MEMTEVSHQKTDARNIDLSLRNLTKVYPGDKNGDIIAVNDLSLSIEPGSFVTLLGPSGCGKTTTLRMIAGFEKPTSGHIFLGGSMLNDVPPNKRGMAMVFQNYALFPHMSVYENISYGLRLRKIDQNTIRNSVEMVLNLMNLVGTENRSPNQLSGGQQQRVALARALVLQPKVLLFDEPLSNLDAKLRLQMRDEIRRLQRRLSITSIYVTHDQTEAMSLSDVIIVMKDGRIEQSGSPTDIYLRPASLFVADFIGDANFVESRIQEIGPSGVIVNLLGTPIQIPRNEQLNSRFPGEEIYLVIRPEAVRVTGALSGFTGEIRKTTYLGGSVQYLVEVNGQFILATDTNPLRERIYSEGTTVGVQFFPECCHLLSRG